MPIHEGQGNDLEIKEEELKALLKSLSWEEELKILESIDPSQAGRIRTSSQKYQEESERFAHQNTGNEDSIYSDANRGNSISRAPSEALKGLLESGMLTMEQLQAAITQMKSSPTKPE